MSDLADDPMTVDGPAVDGPAVDGPAVDGPAVDGPAVGPGGVAEAWACPGGAAQVSLTPIRGVAVIRIRGCLDGAALQPARAALDAAMVQAAPVVVDLRAVAPPAPASVALLGAMRRYALARDTRIALAAVPELLLGALRRARVEGLHQVTATVAQGIDQVLQSPSRPALRRPVPRRQISSPTRGGG